MFAIRAAMLLLAGTCTLAAAAPPQAEVRLPAVELFHLAEKAEQAGDTATAITVYQALTHDPGIALRSEARFRLARLLTAQHRLAEAATLYRAILDEQPAAQRVRLELANLLAQMDDLSGARRMLRQAQAGGLPQDIARAVDQYAAALRSRKPVTTSFEVALAPSTNINRATNAATLDTILAPFQLSDEARAKSGLGVKAGGQFSLRLPLKQAISPLLRISGQGMFYRRSMFNDVVGSVQGGAEARSGDLRVQPLVGRSWRWFGGTPYAVTDTASVNLIKPLGRRAQLEVNAGLGWADYRLNDLQDGPLYNASLSYERAVSSRAGGGLTLFFDRQKAHDPGYATTSVGGQLLGWLEVGRASLYLTASLSRLIADERLFPFRDTRHDWQFRATAGGVFRALSMGRFAPLARLTYESNASTVGLYEYRRFGAEAGLSRAF